MKTFEKNGSVRVARDPAEAVALKFDGYREVKDKEPTSRRSPIPLPGPQKPAEKPKS